MRGARSGPRKPKTDRPKRGMFRRKRVCRFCVDKIPYIDYKDVRMLIASIPERARSSPAGSRASARVISAGCRPLSSEPGNWP